MGQGLSQPLERSEYSRSYYEKEGPMMKMVSNQDSARGCEIPAQGAASCSGGNGAALKSFWISLASLLALVTVLVLCGYAQAADPMKEVRDGLTIIEPDGKPGTACLLEHTSVTADIAGFMTQVRVTQVFRNTADKAIEAVYTFPLSSTAAVHDMTMKIGERVVKGVIMRREEAREIYDKAKAAGKAASLLDQERPNIFTQSVANIMPGDKVEITITYSEILPFKDGAFSFMFPMVVGPRFIPGEPSGASGTGWAHDTNKVPDASRITPPVAKEGTRAGHDIDLTVTINAGVRIGEITSKLHEVTIQRDGDTKATVSLKDAKEIPNRDFVLAYAVAGDAIRSGVIAHKDGPEGYVAIIMIPPKRVTPAEIAPREMIFVIDCSGSQRGRPLDKAKETMRYFIDKMGPNDTFNIIDFNTGARQLFSEPKPNTAEYREKALNYMQKLQAQGGTWMGSAVEQVAKAPAPENRLRIVTFMTDGYVGNDFEIIGLTQKLRGVSRWFPFGTGNSVNHFLLEQMARVGGGEAEIINLNSPSEKVASDFYERIATPVLIDATLSFEGVDLTDIYPAQVSDLWAQKPLVFKARYTKGGKGTITIKGFASGKPYEQTLSVTLPETEKDNAAIPAIWARAKVDDLMDKEWMLIQQRKPSPEVKEEIIKTALAHKIMTQYTSFVAVEERVVNKDGKLETVTVPVELPHGVSEKGIFGDKSAPSPVLHSMEYQTRGVVSKMLGAVGRYAGAMTANKGTRVAEKDEAKTPSAADADMTAKLTPELIELANGPKERGGSRSFTYKGVAVQKGRALVEITLSAVTADALKKLKDMGFESAPDRSTGNKVVGWIPLEKLREMAALPEVTAVKPVSE